MKQWTMNGYSIDQLALIEADRPAPAEDEVLIQIKALSLNYVDLIAIRGQLGQFPLPYTPIADGAGIVIHAGSKVKSLKVGDKVASLFIPLWQDRVISNGNHDYVTRPGLGRAQGQATEFRVAKSHEFIKLPESLELSDAATLPVAGLTAWNILRLGNLVGGQYLLTHGTGGVSLFALQIAKLIGAKVIITTSKEEQRDWLYTLGADHVINYKDKPDWSSEVLELTGGVGVDVVAETVGGNNVQKSVSATKPQGFIGLVGLLHDFNTTVNGLDMLHKNITLRGLEVGSTQDFHDFLRFIESTRLKPSIHQTFLFSELKEALWHMESGKHLGKIVIEL